MTNSGPCFTLERKEKTTISELVRQAVRERYLGNLEQRRSAMQNLVGIRKTPPFDSDAFAEVRRLRRGNRLDRLTG